ncbi:MAG: hypothetical protein A2909_01110 [Candidatus Tagabacteria bacterium RIFCSPLOWO2_01_FULL_39_11]|uniref:Quinate/shikimate 5-dehydrogenase/glutamyl-tRNA reductase domain-containing protein n=1 Tax=Candidatus Tagabacteria bacterium RIFCSPLOWO2_01_FULL_39_11 TaxID=1802295 RepID=A0A1G2LQ01_9BACT|nr:MAG: hypothetical protein A2909_01110 [Candidatus Tagabacteria bacterium RIFCSPLOWO2_01_FULL_39_11]
MDTNNIKFAFLAHPRNIKDLRKNYFLIKLVPEPIFKFLIKFLPPITLSKITGLKNKNGEEANGLIIAILLMPDQMLNLKRDFVQKKIIKAIKLAEKRGAKIAGLGALTSSVTNGGLDLINKINIGITNGNNLTAAIALEDVIKIIKERNLANENHKIAIVGATGSVGSLISKILAEKCKNLAIIARTAENVEKLKKEINEINPLCNIVASVKINDIENADLIISTTAAADAIIKPEYLKSGVIIYDITHPSNISKEVYNKPNISIIKGGLVKTPGINYHLNLGIPKETAFACLTETMLLAVNNKFKNFSLGKTDINKMREIYEYFQKSDFASSPQI